MPMYYAYTPDRDGNEPLGTFGKIIRDDLRTDRGFIRHAVRYLGKNCRCYRIAGSFYRDSDHIPIYPKVTR